eukprot:5976665-Prymnesium_polylepis.1
MRQEIRQSRVRAASAADAERERERERGARKAGVGTRAWRAAFARRAAWRASRGVHRAASHRAASRRA